MRFLIASWAGTSRIVQTPDHDGRPPCRALLWVLAASPPVAQSLANAHMLLARLSVQLTTLCVRIVRLEICCVLCQLGGHANTHSCLCGQHVPAQPVATCRTSATPVLFNSTGSPSALSWRALLLCAQTPMACIALWSRSLARAEHRAVCSWR
jgi:hypothetical protein